MHIAAEDVAVSHTAVTAGESALTSFATQSLAAAHTKPVTPRITMPERNASQLQSMTTGPVITVSKTAQGYVSAMLAAAVLIFFAAISLWWHLNVPAQNVAYAATENAATAVNATLELAPVSKGISPKSDSVWTVIEDQTQAVSNAANAFAADQQMAVIEPGGKLALAMQADQFFGNGLGSDVQVHGPAQECVSYRIFVRNDASAAWQQIDVNRNTFPAGIAKHDIGHHGLKQARQVLIQNDGTSALPIDGVAAAYQNLVINPVKRPQPRKQIIYSANSKEKREKKLSLKRKDNEKERDL